MVWDEEQLDRLWELYRQGLTSSQIGAAIGRSRNAVIGKLMRTGLRDKGYNEGFRERPTPTSRAKAQKQAMGIKVKRAARQKSYITAALEVVAHMEASHPEKMKLCSMLDLEFNSCRFPIGDPATPEFAYCGNEAIRPLPYCPHHARMAYAPPAIRSRRRDASYGPKV